jgi:hypothetical protein
MLQDEALVMRVGMSGVHAFLSAAAQIIFRALAVIAHTCVSERCMIRVTKANMRQDFLLLPMSTYFDSSFLPLISRVLRICISHRLVKFFWSVD